MDSAWIGLTYDREMVWIGAALHDIGKTARPEKLSQPGHMHGAAGHALLQARGYPERIARICQTHAAWATGGPEDTLAAAEHWRRGKRDTGMEGGVTGWIAQETGAASWELFAALDDIATGIAVGADGRLARQGRFPIG